MGKLMVAAARVLPLCAVVLVLPAIASAQCVSQLTVQRVWTQDAGGTDKTSFAPGEPIRFAAELNNSYGAYMLGANGAQLAITTSFYTDTKPVDIPPGISTWPWNATVPSIAANYTVTVRAYDHFCGVWAEGSGSFTIGQSLPSPPRLTLGLNQTNLQPGDTHILTATITPSGSASPVDLYLAIQMPDQPLLFYQLNGSFTAEMMPLVSNWTVTPFSGELYRYTFNGAEPAGTYTWLTAFTDPGTSNIIGDLAQAAFTFNPSPLPNCVDAYFIGMHGMGEDRNSRVIVETAFYFLRAKPSNAVVKVEYPEYNAPLWSSLNLEIARDDGVAKLDDHVQKVLRECPNPKIVLAGYSLGAWIIDEWLN